MRDERTNTNLIKKKRASVRGNAPGFAGRRGIDSVLEIPAGKPDLSRLLSVTEEWLVPLLVDEFLRERGVELTQEPMTMKQENELSSAPIRGGRGVLRRD